MLILLIVIMIIMIILIVKFVINNINVVFFGSGGELGKYKGKRGKEYIFKNK